MSDQPYISAAARAELAQIVREKYGLEMPPDRIDPALRQPSPPSSETLELQNRPSQDERLHLSRRNP
jgi:hypothetical protein